MAQQTLTEKYHVAAPRYTSYPTVPYWDTVSPSQQNWTKEVKLAFDQTNQRDGISIYIHLPYCESLCTYCGCNTRITKNHQVEHPYIDALLQEWSIYLRVFKELPVIKEIHLGGGTPTFFSPENLEKLIQGILKQAKVHPDAEFSFEAHPANTTELHLKTLFNLGFKRLSLGIQDFDPQVQEIINRKQSFNEVKQVTDQARAIGYTSINFDLIYGLPLQTYDGLIETIGLVNLLKPDRIAFYSYAHVPWIKPGQRKFTDADLPSVSKKQGLYQLGKIMFAENGYQEIGMDHFARENDSISQAEKNGDLHRNFMGYTHQYTQLLVGLGVSSISDTGTAFAQNAKKVEEYLELLKTGEFPIIKGHMLTNEDLIIRKHILNIMCKGETNWENDIKVLNVLADTLARLTELQTDGLILADENGLTVTETGKRFLRNICMAFDARLWKNKSETQLFSMAG